MNSIDESVALVTAANQTLQSPATAGKAIRTISLRLTGTKEAKKELEDEGEEIESFVETQSKLRDTILNATKTKSNNFMGFDILNDKGAYKSTYEIMLGIAKLYDEIVENDKKTGAKNMNLLLETIAGKNRAAAAASILQNASLLEDVYNESMFESTNSAIIENEKYLDSLSGHIAKLKTAWQELQTTMVDSSFLKGLTDIGTGALKGTTGLMNQLSPTSLLMTLMGGVAGLNGIGPVSFNRHGEMKHWFGSSMSKDTNEFISRINQQITQAALTSEDAVNMSVVRIGEAMDGLNNVDPHLKELVSTLHDGEGSVNSFTTAVENNKTAWSQLKQVALSTLASMGVAFATSLITDFAMKVADAPKAIAESAADAGNTIKNETKSIEEYRKKVSDLYEIINDPNSSIEEQTNARQELLNIQNELMSNYDNEASMLSSVSSSAEAASSAFDRLAESQYRLNMAKFANDEDSGFIKKLANTARNAMDGYDDNVDRMIGEMGRQQINNAVSRDVLNRNKKLREELIRIYEGNDLEVFQTGLFDNGNISMVGSARDVQNALNDARKAVENFRYSMSEEDYESATKSLEHYSHQIELTVGKYGELNDQRTKFYTIANDKDYRKSAENLEKYFKDYKEAFASGDKESIDDAVTNFTREYNNALAKAGTDGETGRAVKEYFDNLYSTMSSVMGEKNFKNDLENNLGGMKDVISEFFNNFKDYTTEDFLNFKMLNPSTEAEEAWTGLVDLAREYNLEIEQLIPILEDMGMVQSDSYKRLTEQYKDHINEISNYTPEELQIAYRLAADGMSFEDLDAQIQKERGLIEIGFDIHDRSGLEAYNEIASNQKSKHADYDQYKKMIEDAQALRKEGRIGEEQFKQAAKLISEFGMTDAKN